MSAHQNPHPDLLTALARLLGSPVVQWHSIQRGYTAAERWICTLADNRTVFVKCATDERTKRWLEAEWNIYRSVHASFMPKTLGYSHANNQPFLVLEDLSHATWPAPWTTQSIQIVQKGLASLRATKLPHHLESLEHLRPELGGWIRIAENSDLFLSLKVCSKTWLTRYLPVLMEAEQATVLSGNELVHLDIRSDNLCILKNQVKFIDWNYARYGNGLIDLIGWLPSLHLEGGPAPWIMVEGEPEMVSLIAGYFAYHAPLPPHSPNPLHREFQKAQLRIALHWAARALDIPIPEEVLSLP